MNKFQRIPTDPDSSDFTDLGSPTSSDACKIGISYASENSSPEELATLRFNNQRLIPKRSKRANEIILNYEAQSPNNAATKNMKSQKKFDNVPISGTFSNQNTQSGTGVSNTSAGTKYDIMNTSCSSSDDSGQFSNSALNSFVEQGPHTLFDSYSKASVLPNDSGDKHNSVYSKIKVDPFDTPLLFPEVAQEKRGHNYEDTFSKAKGFNWLGIKVGDGVPGKASFLDYFGRPEKPNHVIHSPICNDLGCSQCAIYRGDSTAYYQGNTMNNGSSGRDLSKKGDAPGLQENTGLFPGFLKRKLWGEKLKTLSNKTKLLPKRFSSFGFGEKPRLMGSDRHSDGTPTESRKKIGKKIVFINFLLQVLTTSLFLFNLINISNKIELDSVLRLRNKAIWIPSFTPPVFFAVFGLTHLSAGRFGYFVTAITGYVLVLFGIVLGLNDPDGLYMIISKFFVVSVGLVLVYTSSLLDIIITNYRVKTWKKTMVIASSGVFGAFTSLIYLFFAEVKKDTYLKNIIEAILAMALLVVILFAYKYNTKFANKLNGNANRKNIQQSRNEGIGRTQDRYESVLTATEQNDNELVRNKILIRPSSIFSSTDGFRRDSSRNIDEKIQAERREVDEYVERSSILQTDIFGANRCVGSASNNADIRYVSTLKLYTHIFETHRDYCTRWLGIIASRIFESDRL